MTTNYKILGQAVNQLKIDAPENGSTIISELKIKNTSYPTNVDVMVSDTFESIPLLDNFNPNASNNVSSIALQSDGKILIGGIFSTIGGVTRNYIARLNSDGTLDTGFNPDANGNVYSIALQSDGKILIGGIFTTIGGVTRNYIARLNSDGTLDIDRIVSSSVLHDIKLQQDGKILVAGDFDNISGIFGEFYNNIARLNSDGRPDTSFNPDPNSTVFSIALQSDGKILIGGNFTTIGGVTRNRIARLNSDGSLDTDFNPNASSIVNSMALQPDGKIIIVGWFTTIGGVTRNHIARLNSDGTLDTGFSPSASSGGASRVNSVVLQPDGKIIFGGLFDTVNGVTRNYIARLNSDGTLDNNFNPNPQNTVDSIALQPDGKIIIGGRFQTVNNLTANTVARLKEVVNNAPYKLAYTVPENTQVILKNIFVTNHNNFPIFHDIAILPEEQDKEVISEKHYYVWDNLIDENDYDKIESSVTLSTGDEIYVYSSTDEDISFNIFGVEITD